MPPPHHTGDIAIIGMSCRVAGAECPSELWDLLAASKDVRKEIDRFNSAGYYSAGGAKRKGLTNVRHAYLMDQELDRFDNAFFSIPASEATAMDPQQRLLLELSYEAIENAGIPLEAFQGTDTAVYCGLFTNDYGTSLLRDIDAIPKYHSTGASNSIAANRISYFYDLHGPSMVIDTACSSTMVALHQAVLSLKINEANMALVCGANLILNPDMFVHMSELGFLSPDGRCKSFDASGDGYARGEGVLALLLKPLNQAIEDGDPIRSVIRGTRINQDGRTSGITLPSSEAQKRNLKALYDEHGLLPGDVQYLEAHGTGTAVGDPIEMSAIDAVFSGGGRADNLIVGSIKSNVGHLEACAAIVGIIKAVECLERGQIPPQMHFVNPNPNIDFKSITIPTAMMNWPSSALGVRRAAVNSFGFGGTNGHVVLDHYPLETPTLSSTGRPYLFKLSAKTESALGALAVAYADYVKSRTPSLGDLAYTLLSRRSTLKKSLFLTASTHSELIDKLESWETGSSKPLSRTNTKSPTVGFVFTGQGAQWPEMGRQLISLSTIFAAVIDQCDGFLATLRDRPAWKIREELCKPQKLSNINHSSFSQPLCTALQLGLVEVWKDWGVIPRAVFGHSSGEVAAAFAAGILTLRDAIIIAYYRGLHMGRSSSSTESLEPKGAMCAVGICETECQILLEPYFGRAVVAAINSPTSCTLSGDEEAIREIWNISKERGFFCRMLHVDMAYHSPHMLPLAPGYERSLHEAGILPAACPVESGCQMFSSVTGRRLSPRDCTPDYWVKNMVSPVQFSAALTETIRAHDLDVFVEVGPHPALKGPAMDTLAVLGKDNIVYFGTLCRNKPTFDSLLITVGGMVNAGLQVLTGAVNSMECMNGRKATGKVLTDIPKYQWDHSVSYWGETRVSKNQRFRKFPRHQLLGARVNSDTPLSPRWRNLLKLEEVEWLEAMIAAGETKMPKSAFILMAIEAAQQFQTTEKPGNTRVRLSSIQFLKDLPLAAMASEEGNIETHFALETITKSRELRFTISAAMLRAESPWEEYCCGTMTFSTTSQAPPILRRPLIHDPTLLEHIETSNLFKKSSFETLSVEGDHANGEFTNLDYDNGHYHINPTVLTSLMQVPSMLMTGFGLGAEHQLDFIDALELPLGLWSFGHASFDAVLRRISPIRSLSDVQIYDTHGHYISFHGMWSKVYRSIQRTLPLQSLFYKPEILPDITFLSSAESLSIARMVQLVTHKWPMSDFGVADVSIGDFEAFLSHLKGLHDHERARFRSVTVKSDEPASDRGRLRTVRAFSKVTKFHMLISSVQHLQSLYPHIRSNGVACLRVQTAGDKEIIDEQFDPICKVDGFDSGDWVLGRFKSPLNGVAPTRKLKIFGCEGTDVASLLAQREFEYVELRETAVTICEKQEEPQDHFDLIVLDCGPRSMLVDWAGCNLLPWIQCVLEHVGNLLWVSNQVDNDPFSSVAGSFIRTLQSEHPSMKAASLIVQNSQDFPSLARTIFEVFDKMTHDSNEVEVFAQGQQVCALRYIPDDSLSASVGVIPPHMSEEGLGSSNYELSLVGPSSAVVLSSYRNILEPLDTESLHISVKASIIDFDDTALFADTHPHKDSWTGLGQFFVGTIRTEGHAKLRYGELVVGWHLGAHKSILQVPSCHLRLVPEGMPPAEAVAHYAAYALAFAAVHGTARARRSETIQIQQQGILAEALTNVCQVLNLHPTMDEGVEADFLVTSDSTRGLLINDKRVSVKNYMTSDDSNEWLVGSMSCYPKLGSRLLHFEIEDFQRAFEVTKSCQGLSLLVHDESRNLKRHLLTYKPSNNLFRPDAAYVVVGGLGGLGRYLMIWMVKKGARFLVTLSRSGLNSADAGPTVAAVQKLGAEIWVYKGDACNADLVNQVMTEVRKHRPIRGYFNMVLVLDDSPFITMKGSQWDRALRSKVDSAWNLHNAASSDELDMFIMFSSISSIAGNRTQANYATGNSFQNALAYYRRSLGLPGLAIALGAVSGIGVLANDHNLLRTLSKTGFQALRPDQFTKIIEAAVLESQNGDRSLISTGLEVFETLDDVIQCTPDQNQLFWTEWPEFGLLFDHKFRTTEAVKAISLREQLWGKHSDEIHKDLLQAFGLCISSVLGYDVASLDPGLSLASYGVDSLNAISCRYWFFQELNLDVPVFDILGCRSIGELLVRVQTKLEDQSRLSGPPPIPQPVQHSRDSLSVRPISRSQSRLWFLHRFLPDKTIYNLLLVCHISGTVDVKLFTEAWSMFVQRHEILHSRIINTAEGVQQLPRSNPTFPMLEVEATEETFQGQVESITEAARSLVFDLESGELVRGWLLRSPRRWRFFLASHHLAWDRTSVPIIFDEITSIYKSLSKGEPIESSLLPVTYQFIDYTLWQEDWMAKPELIQPHVEYWKAQLDGIPESVSLFSMALVSKRPAMKRYKVNSVLLDLDSSLATAIKAFCKTAAVTPFMFMTSALTALIHRFTGDVDILVGIADGDRGHTGFDKLVGFTVNMLAIRTKISKNMLYTTLLEDYRNACLEAYEHRAVPFDYLLQQIKVPRRTSHSPVFQVTVNYQMQGAFPECDFGDFKFTEYDHYNAKSQSDWMLDVEETLSGNLHCLFSFDTSLYDDTAISSVADTFKVLIENILATEGQVNLDRINLVPAEDQKFIASVLQPSFEDGPSLEDLESDLFPTLFRKAVSAHPTKPAVIDDSRVLTWNELEIATNRVVRFLVNSGAQVGENIGICCEATIDMIIAMYGTVMAGCVYVPIDPDFPEERMSYMLEDTKVKHVLVDRVGSRPYQRVIACGVLSADIHVISEIATAVKTACTSILRRKVAKPDALCCIFTSGSTGRPKGIYIGHTQIRYQMEGYHARIGTNSEDRILLSSAMVFDMSLTSIYGTVLRGATMVIASREARYTPAKMVEQLIERRVSNCTFTTTQLKVLLTAPNKARLVDWTSLRSMVVGGEQIPPWVVRDFHNLNLPQAHIFNGYAPAETTVCNSLRRLRPEDASKMEIPLERPLFPSRFHILDESLKPVPVGISGEMYIGGPTVNEGYVNRDEITATVFLRDPFASTSEIEAGMGKLYRTGDSFRLMRDGTIQALGRIGDQRQVKIRGMRTELDEIESVIYDACQAVEDLDVCPVTLVAVVYHKTSSDEGVLAAYLAASEGAEKDERQRRSLKAYIRLRMKASLPVHMIPSAFVFVPQLPQLVSEKIDYKTVLTWDPPAPETDMLSENSLTKEPLNKIQSAIASVWKDVLHFKGDLSAADEFFALGGHSLILLHVQDGIKECCGATLSLTDMFANPTVGGMEKLVLAQRGSEKHALGEGSDGAGVTITVPGTNQPFIDWEKEGSLPSDADWYLEPCPMRSASVVAITGACTMAGAHFIHHVLSDSEMTIFCIANEAPSDDDARSNVIDTLKHWQLLGGISPQSLQRLIVYRGSLSHPTLGLTTAQIKRLDSEVHAIYQLDSEVSLLKRYENLRASNVGSLQFLVSLAHGQVNNTKSIHYLSTWGVPHLQAWNETELQSPEWLTSEVEMTNMKPGADGTLGYLKARWACESILYHAARRGIPVTIFRSCMCAGSPASSVPLPRTDINRRILEGSLQVGLVPDFGSARGGGMSWITADFLVQSMLHLSQRPSSSSSPSSAGPTANNARIYHIVSGNHVPYTKLADILDVSYAGEKMRTVRPEEWFDALKASGDPEMAMQAEVLESWCQAGWVPFGLEAKETLELLREEKGLVPPELERDMLLKLVVGEKGF